MIAELNPAQQQAVLHNNGPLLVVAGAGSGKTRVITCKIAHLVEECHVPDRYILAVTFTNKAAEEMRSRAAALLNRHHMGATICTFHSLCLRILRQEAHQLGYSADFSVCDPADGLVVIKDVLTELGYRNDKRHTPRKVQALVSGLKNQSRQLETEKLPDLDNILDHYDRSLKAQNLMDFDDLLLNTVMLLEQFPHVADHYRGQFPYILVDEFQDTNAIQYRIVRQLAGTATHVCVVGDEDQSIYGWRGADFENILNFPRDFADTTVIKLEENYRSTRAILDIANAVISNNTMRNPKQLKTSSAAEGEQIIHGSANPQGEAAQIGRQIKALLQQEIRPRDIVVLYRANYLSRSLEDALRRENIAYRIVGGYKFYDRKEIKDILGYLKVLRNPEDNLSFRRIVNVPRRKVGPATLDRLEAVDPVLSRSLEKLPESFPRRNELMELAQVLADFRKRDIFDQAFVQDLIDAIGYVDMLKAEEEPLEAQSRMENLLELQQVVADYVAEAETPSLAGFLDQISLLSDTDELDTAEMVNLMTIHCAKGLEFHTVFVVGLEEGTFPNQRTVGSSRELEEERRLMYVAITRARRNLYLSYARERGFGWDSQRKRISRFLKEIPDQLVSRKGEPHGLPGGMLSASHVARPLTGRPKPTAGSVPAKGSSVIHATYGEGTVLNIVNGDRLVIKFKRAGIKVLNAGMVASPSSD